MRVEERSEHIHDALNFLDNEMIEDVEELRGNVVEISKEKKRFFSWNKWTAFAAVMALIILVGGVGNGYSPEFESSDMNNVTPDQESMQENIDKESNDSLDSDAIFDEEHKAEEELEETEETEEETETEE